MKIITIQTATHAPEVFKFPRTPESDLWFGYIEYVDSIEYQGKKYKADEKNKHKIRKHIINRIEEKAGKFVESVEINKYIDDDGNIMYAYQLFGHEKRPIRINITHTGLEMLIDKHYVALKDLVRSQGVSNSPDGNFDGDKYHWKRLSTKIGKEKLLERIVEWLDDKTIQDLKIHYSTNGGIYAVHKSVRKD